MTRAGNETVTADRCENQTRLARIEIIAKSGSSEIGSDLIENGR